MSDDDLIHPETLFPLTRRRYPAVGELIDDAETSVPAMRRMGREWVKDHVKSLLPIEAAGQSLVLRSSLFAVLITERAVQLSEGIARELEADAVFPAATVARAQLDLIGLSAYAREHVQQLAPDVHALEAFTGRLLFASRSLPGAAHFRTAELINTPKLHLGDHFGEDYGFLSYLTHPNGMIIFGSHDSLEEDPLPPIVDKDRAMLLVKIAGQGLRAVGHNAILTIDWAVDNDVFLPSSGGSSPLGET